MIRWSTLLAPLLVVPVVATANGPQTVPRGDERPAEPSPTLRGVARHPDAIGVLVNKRVRLPRGFVPRGLVVPDVRFTFSGFHEKRQLRRVAARALERMFGAAARDGVPLAGVSGYRSEATQRDLFGLYVAQLGRAEAERVSAQPGRSEHQTGLAIDVAGADGRCPASSCFAGTRPARWIARNAARFGFVVRYPDGGEGSTGYRYEPWHLRYLGRALATTLADAGLTYEELLEGGAGAP